MDITQQDVLSDRAATWKLVTIFATLIAIMAVSIYTFQHRNPIIEALVGHKIFMANPTTKAPYPGIETKKEIQKFADSRPEILGITVSKSDFELNTRTVTYHYFKQKDIQKSWEATDGVARELFGENTVQNARIVDLINGQFVCTPTADSLGAKFHPILLRYSKTMCSIAVPPGYGDFLGWINFYMVETPTFAELEVLEVKAAKISRDMYERDILQKQKSSFF